MVKKLPERRNNFFSFFLNFFSHFPSPLTEINKTTYFFRPFYYRKQKNRKGKRPIKNLSFLFFFFFFLTFLHPTAPRNRENYHLPFFRNSDLKCPKIAISALKFHFLQITFFSAVITRTHHLPTHTPFFRPIMCKKRALNLFLKITFFSSLLLLLTSETLPHHLFGQTSDQKWLKNLSKGGKNFFTFCYNFFHIFPLLLRKKTKPHTFSALFITGNRKTARENVPSEFFFFFNLTFFHPTAPRNPKNYHVHFFRNSDLKCPKMPLSALKFHFLQITFFSALITRTHTRTHTHSVFPTHYA